MDEETIAILKNFCLINKSILIKPGNRISTKVNQADSIIAAATIEEEFPEEFGINDLSEFLSVLSMFDDPTITFANNYKVSIQEGKAIVNYSFYNPALLTAAPRTLVDLPAIAQFELSTGIFNKILKAGSIMALPHLSINGDGETISLGVLNTENKSSNIYKIEIGDTDLVFNALLETESINIINGSYSVTVSRKNVKFDSIDKKLTYWFALSKNSRF